MPRVAIAGCVSLALAAIVFAQTPQPPRPPVVPTGIRPAALSLDAKSPPPKVVVEAPQAPHLTLIKVDPRDTSVRLNEGRWQLWSGKTMLKDFGKEYNDAHKARRIVAELQLTERGQLGSPEPAMEFWLSNGQAPPLTSSSRTVVPFDAGSLNVDVVDGAHWVRDRTKLLYNFGPYQSDAQHALALLKQFGFNEIAFIGSPTPTMSYLVKNDQPRTLSIGKNDPFTIQRLPQTTPRHPLQLYRLGNVGEREPFDALKLEIRRQGEGWHLTAGIRDLDDLGPSQHSARTALRVVQSYPFTERIRVGTGSLSFYLSRGMAPRGVPLGVRRTAFNPRSLTVKTAGDVQQITDSNRVIAQLPGTVEEAKVAVKVLQHYQFDCLCEVGQLRYFAKER